MNSKITAFWLILTLALFMASCKEEDGFSALEEIEAFFGAETPLITKVKGIINGGIDDVISLDFNNERIGSDAKMSYSCMYDTSIDGKTGSARNCSELPDDPTEKFDPSTGKFTWGPISSLGEYELIIKGSNKKGSDTSYVGILIDENAAPKIGNIFDQVLTVDSTLSLKAMNLRDTEDTNTQYTCQFDTVLDNKVDSGQNCQQLPGDPAIKFDVTTGTFTWSPKIGDEGEYELKMIAINDLGSDEVIFVVRVGESSEKKVRLSYLRDQYLYPGDTLSIDASNQVTGDDEGVAYSCYYDAVINGIVENSLSCDTLPGTPSQKFNTITGALTWTPSLNQETEMEVKIVGQKDGDSDSQLFLISFSTQRFGEVGNSAITFDPTSFDFGSVSLGEASTGQDITLTNSASADIYIGSIAMSNSEFIVNWSSCPNSTTKFESQDTCIVNVSYQPITAAQLGAFLNVKFGKSSDTSLEFSSILGLSGRGVGTLNFDGLQTISNVTHNSLTLNWNETTEAASF